MPNRPRADARCERQWLELLDDEKRPTVLRGIPPSTVVWSSVRINRPEAVVEFDLASDGGYGTDLTWTFPSTARLPDDALIGHRRKRVNQLINAELRYSFGQ